MQAITSSKWASPFFFLNATRLHLKLHFGNEHGLTLCTDEMFAATVLQMDPQQTDVTSAAHEQTVTHIPAVYFPTLLIHIELKFFVTL